MNSNEIFAVIFAVLAVLLFVFANFQLLSVHDKNLFAIETVKSQLSSAKSGLVSFPVPDLAITSVFSIASFAAGISVGMAAMFLFRKKIKA